MCNTLALPEIPSIVLHPALRYSDRCQIKKMQTQARWCRLTGTNGMDTICTRRSTSFMRSKGEMQRQNLVRKNYANARCGTGERGERPADREQLSAQTRMCRKNTRAESFQIQPLCICLAEWTGLAHMLRAAESRARDSLRFPPQAPQGACSTP